MLGDSHSPGPRQQPGAQLEICASQPSHPLIAAMRHPEKGASLSSAHHDNHERGCDDDDIMVLIINTGVYC